MVCTLVGIPCLSCVKDKHPWNLIATWLWSTLLAVFLAAADIPDAYARAHSMFIIMTMLAFGVFLLLLLTQLPGLKTPEGNPGLLSFGVAGLISWVTWLSAAIALKATVPLFMTEEFDTGPFVSSCVVSSIVFASRDPRSNAPLPHTGASSPRSSSRGSATRRSNCRRR